MADEGVMTDATKGERGVWRSPYIMIGLSSKRALSQPMVYHATLFVILYHVSCTGVDTGGG